MHPPIGRHDVFGLSVRLCVRASLSSTCRFQSAVALAIGNGSVPKIIINNTPNLFFKLQSTFW